MLTHALLFIASICVIWFCAGLIVDSVERVARRFKKSGFMTAFFILGMLTSLGELSVAVNSHVAGTPQVSAGNLLGASMTLLLFVVPLLAVVGGKVKMESFFRDKSLLLILGVIAIPSFAFLDGNISVSEGIVSIAAYVILIWSMRTDSLAVAKAAQKTDVFPNVGHLMSATLDLTKIIVAAVVIFFAGSVLVEETVAIANIIGAPTSLVALVVLSIGTNIPELTIAVRSLLKKRTDVALGNYLGSAAVNTLIFGLLAIVSGPFAFDTTGFVVSFGFLIVGLIVFFNLMHSKSTLTRNEGIVLLLIYAAFLSMQVFLLVEYAVN